MDNQVPRGRNSGRTMPLKPGESGLVFPSHIGRLDSGLEHCFTNGPHFSQRPPKVMEWAASPWPSARREHRMPTILQAITRLSPTGLQGVRDMLMRDEVGPRKFANQRLITEPDGQAPPMTCSVGRARGSHQRTLPSEPCGTSLQDALRRVSLCYRTFVPTPKASAGHTIPINPSFSHCVPSRNQPTPIGFCGPVWPRSFSREMDLSRLSGWPWRVTGRVHVHVVMAMEKSHAMRVYHSYISRAHRWYANNNPPPDGFSFPGGTSISSLYRTAVVQWAY